MRYAKGYYKRIKQELKGKKWYHQRFDGCPFLLTFIAEAELKKEIRKYDAGSHTKRAGFFKNNRADWYILMDDIVKTTDMFLKISKEDPDFTKKLIERWDEDNKKFYDMCKRLGKTDLSRLSDKQLIDLYKECRNIGVNRQTSSSLIDGFALGSDEIIAKKILDHLTKLGLEKEYPKIFSMLTAPVHLSFINEAEISLLKIACEVNKNKKLKNIFLNKKPEEIEKIIHKYPKILKALKKHQKDYFWTKNNYVTAQYLSIEHFIEEMKHYLMYNNVEKELEKIKNTPYNNKLKKEKLIKKLKILFDLKNLLTYSEDFTFWQDERKKATFWTAHYFSLLLKEIGKRNGFSLEEIKYLTLEEAANIFNRKPAKEEMMNRLDNCAAVWTRKAHEVIIGKEVEELRKIVLGELDFSKIKELHGLCASVGYAKGIVKVVKSATEVSKVNRGDILVAIMTRPDYVVAMKKAKAIITNEGGITSHAAIVSRELKIPCVIGTRIAANVLKDGDIVEVDANKGLVRVLKR